MKKSWKTTFCGLIAVASPILAGMFPEFSPLILKGAAVITGVGLCAARDNDVSSEEAGAVRRALNQR